MEKFSAEYRRSAKHQATEIMWLSEVLIKSDAEFSQVNLIKSI